MTQNTGRYLQGIRWIALYLLPPLAPVFLWCPPILRVEWRTCTTRGFSSRSY